MQISKSRRVQIAAFAAATALMSVAGTCVAESVKLQPKRVFENLGKLDLPAAAVVAPDGSGRQFLVQQGGTIRILPSDPSGGEAKMFLDISDRNLIAHKFEEGLLGLAFHPRFKDNGKFYLYYTKQSPKRARVVEMKVKSDDRDAADLSAERVLMEIPQPFWNHNSGNILFGPDGFLYIGVGDGGKGGDPLQLGQNVFVLNGTILRIDVDRKDGDLEYGIPKDNPFIAKSGKTKGKVIPGHRPEIYAYGLRNPWGLFFDKAGRLWCADVGQALWEEINLIENGGNYGWSIREGKIAFPEALGNPPQDAKFIDPIHQYPRKDGISITGGFVYNGEKIPALKGAYIYGDWGFGTLWALRYDFENNKVIDNQVIYKRAGNLPGFKPSAITPTADGEIMISSWNGQIFVMEAK